MDAGERALGQTAPTPHAEAPTPMAIAKPSPASTPQNAYNQFPPVSASLTNASSPAGGQARPSAGGTTVHTSPGPSCIPGDLPDLIRRGFLPTPDDSLREFAMRATAAMRQYRSNVG